MIDQGPQRRRSRPSGSRRRRRPGRGLVGLDIVDQLDRIDTSDARLRRRARPHHAGRRRGGDRRGPARWRGKARGDQGSGPLHLDGRARPLLTGDDRVRRRRRRGCMNERRHNAGKSTYGATCGNRVSRRRPESASSIRRHHDLSLTFEFANVPRSSCPTTYERLATLGPNRASPRFGCGAAT